MKLLWVVLAIVAVLGLQTPAAWAGQCGCTKCGYAQRHCCGCEPRGCRCRDRETHRMTQEHKEDRARLNRIKEDEAACERKASRNGCCFEPCSKCEKCHKCGNRGACSCQEKCGCKSKCYVKAKCQRCRLSNCKCKDECPKCPSRCGSSGRCGCERCGTKVASCGCTPCSYTSSCYITAEDGKCGCGGCGKRGCGKCGSYRPSARKCGQGYRCELDTCGTCHRNPCHCRSNVSTTCPTCHQSERYCGCSHSMCSDGWDYYDNWAVPDEDDGREYAGTSFLRGKDG